MFVPLWSNFILLKLAKSLILKILFALTLSNLDPFIDVNYQPALNQQEKNSLKLPECVLPQFCHPHPSRDIQPPSNKVQKPQVYAHSQTDTAVANPPIVDLQQPPSMNNAQ